MRIPAFRSQGEFLFKNITKKIDLRRGCTARLTAAAGPPQALASPIATPLQGGRPERPGRLFLKMLPGMCVCLLYHPHHPNKPPSCSSSMVTPGGSAWHGISIIRLHWISIQLELFGPPLLHAPKHSSP